MGYLKLIFVYSREGTQFLDSCCCSLRHLSIPVPVFTLCYYHVNHWGTEKSSCAGIVLQVFCNPLNFHIDLLNPCSHRLRLLVNNFGENWHLYNMKTSSSWTCLLTLMSKKDEKTVIDSSHIHLFHVTWEKKNKLCFPSSLGHELIIVPPDLLNWGVFLLCFSIVVKKKKSEYHLY